MLLKLKSKFKFLENRNSYHSIMGGAILIGLLLKDMWPGIVALLLLLTWQLDFNLKMPFRNRIAPQYIKYSLIYLFTILIICSVLQITFERVNPLDILIFAFILLSLVFLFIAEIIAFISKKLFGQRDSIGIVLFYSFFPIIFTLLFLFSDLENHTVDSRNKVSMSSVYFLAIIIWILNTISFILDARLKKMRLIDYGRRRAYSYINEQGFYQYRLRLVFRLLLLYSVGFSFLYYGSSNEMTLYGVIFLFFGFLLSLNTFKKFRRKFEL